MKQWYTLYISSYCYSIIMYSVPEAMSFFIRSAFLMSIAMDCCLGEKHDVELNVTRSPVDREVSTQSVNTVALNYDAIVPSPEWYHCVYKSSMSSVLLQNCNLTYIHKRAFAKWPRIQVRKYTHIIKLSYFISLVVAVFNISVTTKS